MGKKNKNNKVKGNVFTLFTKIFIILTIIGIIVWGGVYAVNYMIDGKNSDVIDDGNDTVLATKKDVVSALICGESQNLTDTMIYLRYEVSTGKLAFISVPRDTYVKNIYSSDNKLNSIYQGENIEPLVTQIEKLLDVDIDYYLIVDNKLVREVVDILGGVEINVPIRMKYDDPEQNLHINLQPGLQVLDGAKAEQFIRFRHNNDFTVQYPDADLGRTKAQQAFIKAFIKELLSPSNIVKSPTIIQTILANTVTNVTAREALRYVTDIPNLKLDNIYSCTAPGTTPTIDGRSYFKMDEVEAQRIIKEDFITTPIITTPSTITN